MVSRRRGFAALWCYLGWPLGLMSARGLGAASLAACAAAARRSGGPRCGRSACRRRGLSARPRRSLPWAWAHGGAASRPRSLALLPCQPGSSRRLRPQDKMRVTAILCVLAHLRSRVCRLAAPRRTPPPKAQRRRAVDGHGPAHVRPEDAEARAHILPHRAPRVVAPSTSSCRPSRPNRFAPLRFASSPSSS